MAPQKGDWEGGREEEISVSIRPEFATLSSPVARSSTILQEGAERREREMEGGRERRAVRQGGSAAPDSFLSLREEAEEGERWGVERRVLSPSARSSRHPSGESVPPLSSVPSHDLARPADSSLHPSDGRLVREVVRPHRVVDTVSPVHLSMPPPHMSLGILSQGGELVRERSRGHGDLGGHMRSEQDKGWIGGQEEEEESGGERAAGREENQQQQQQQQPHQQLHAAGHGVATRGGTQELDAREGGGQGVETTRQLTRMGMLGAGSLSSSEHQENWNVGLILEQECSWVMPDGTQNT